MGDRIHLSHLRKLTGCGINITDLTNNNIAAAFNRMRTKHPNLSVNYLISILTTVKKKNPAVTITPRFLNLKKQKRAIYGQTNPITVTGFVKVLRHTIRYLHSDEESDTVLRDLDARIGLVVAIITNIGSKELERCTYRNLQELHNNEPCTLAMKSKYTNAPVHKVEPLFSRYIDDVFRAIEHRELNMLDKDTKQISVSLATPVIRVKIDSVNKYMNEMYGQLNEQRPTESLGVQFIRKINQTTLVSAIEQLQTDEIDDVLQAATQNYVADGAASAATVTTKPTGGGGAAAATIAVTTPQQPVIAMEEDAQLEYDEF